MREKRGLEREIIYKKRLLYLLQHYIKMSKLTITTSKDNTMFFNRKAKFDLT